MCESSRFNPLRCRVQSPWALMILFPATRHTPAMYSAAPALYIAGVYSLDELRCGSCLKAYEKGEYEVGASSIKDEEEAVGGVRLVGGWECVAPDSLTDLCPGVSVYFFAADVVASLRPGGGWARLHV